MNERKFKNVFKIFFAWQEKKEENWLREMSNEGWHLDNTGFLNYTFRKGEPKDMVYRLDFKITRSENIDDYITLYEDAGWEYISKMGPFWYYFRIEPEEGLSPELYSDNASKIKMYNSLRWLIIILCVPVAYNLPNLYLGLIRAFRTGIMDDISTQAVMVNLTLPLVIFFTLALFLMIYGVIRISLVIKRIRLDIKE